MSKETLIYKYFSNSLTKVEKNQFEELLANDNEFRTQFEFENNLKQAIDAEKTNELKAKLKGFEQKMHKDNKVIKPRFSMWRMVASIALLISVTYFGYQSFFTQPDFSTLYADNYKTYPNTVYTITRSDSDNSLERQAFVAYETEDYQLALDKFSQATPKKYFNFYKAQSYLKLGKTTEAKNLFQKIIANKQQFTAEANWYLALIYLKEKNKEEAKKHLKNLINNYDYNKEKSKALLENLS